MSSYPGIYAVVSRIPRGRVATYGQVARLAGLPGEARLVGYALSALREKSPVPWHRVVNAKGQISQRADGDPIARVQHLRLRREGVVFGEGGGISLARFRWRPRGGRLRGSPAAARGVSLSQRRIARR